MVLPRRESVRRSGSGVTDSGESPSKRGTSATTTPGSSTSLNFNGNVLRRSAEASDRLRKSSGMTTVTKLPSPRGKRHTYSSTASSGPSSPDMTSRWGAPWNFLRKRGRMPGSLPAAGTWTAWKSRHRKSRSRTKSPPPWRRRDARRRRRPRSSARRGKSMRAPRTKPPPTVR